MFFKKTYAGIAATAQNASQCPRFVIVICT